MNVSGTSETAEEYRPSRFGRAFYRVGPEMDRRGAIQHRVRMLSELTGNVVEIGAGYGATFWLYPPLVTEVLALEPDAFLRRHARHAAEHSGLNVRVVPDMAESIPCDDASMDAVVSSLVLCSVERQETVLAEIGRVLKPGGVLVFYEHVRSRSRMVAGLQDLATPLWRRAAGGCRPNRDTVRAITQAGFTMDSVERFGFRVNAFAPPVAHVIGCARRVGAEVAGA
ncbi:class I SAM-dependent methyltransferase [Homoserinimonas sp. OAct 916]|uniref:class I SAM-dependent methyltransferase n=1 Tax=Homoserinimonas sp. OAct 916 TaxID=2211450 RepID=UPI000DBE2F3C|nr:class I SAM-dependent methyltransferase [Homoserinimonas sp. OAct 916]